MSVPPLTSDATKPVTTLPLSSVTGPSVSGAGRAERHPLMDPLNYIKKRRLM
jgi:hypothetical protein